MFVAEVALRLCDGKAVQAWDHDPPAKEKLVPFGFLVLGTGTLLVGPGTQVERRVIKLCIVRPGLRPPDDLERPASGSALTSRA